MYRYYIFSCRVTVVEYLRKSIGKHNLYVSQFIFCEFLNLLIIIGQIFFMDHFFNRYFLTYGSDLLSNLENGNRRDVMEKIFPKVTKCTFNKYGVSGTLENKDGK